MRRVLVTTGLWTLACGGLGGDADPGAKDPAQIMLDARDYAGAEANLHERIAADAKDALAWRLLGDVSFIRGQDFKPRWKENLAKATDAYASAVAADPSRCRSWSRLAIVVQARAAQEETAAPTALFDKLPWDQGWENCPGPALLALAENRIPTEAELDKVYAEAGKRATEYDVAPLSQPQLAKGYSLLDYSDLSWKEGFDRPEPKAGGAFAVLETPAPAAGIAGSVPRTFNYAEDITIQSASGGRLVYMDRRFPATKPEKGVTLAEGCPGTKWDIEGPDNYPMGTCAPGEQSRRKSSVYGLDKLVSAGPAHWEHSTFPKARVSWDVIAEGSVMCTGGRVGRLYVETPTCNVDFDRAIPQKRSVQADKGLTALDRAHAEKIVRSKRMSTLYGDDLAHHLAAGEIAVGLPYTLVSYSLPTMMGCQGRALYTKSQIVDGSIAVVCEYDGFNHTFIDLQLTAIKAL